MFAFNNNFYIDKVFLFEKMKCTKSIMIRSKNNNQKIKKINHETYSCNTNNAKIPKKLIEREKQMYKNGCKSYRLCCFHISF